MESKEAGGRGGVLHARGRRRRLQMFSRQHRWNLGQRRSSAYCLNRCALHLAGLVVSALVTAIWTLPSNGLRGLAPIHSFLKKNASATRTIQMQARPTLLLLLEGFPIVCD